MFSCFHIKSDLERPGHSPSYCEMVRAVKQVLEQVWFPDSVTWLWARDTDLKTCWKLFFHVPGRRNSSSQDGQAFPLSVLDSSQALHDPDQDPPRGLRLRLAPVQVVRAILPRRPDPELSGRLRHRRGRLLEVVYGRCQRTAAHLQQDLDASV